MPQNLDRNRTNPLKNDSLSFQPVTEGLGFHPFSDGLPYAPVGKPPQANSSSLSHSISKSIPKSPRTPSVPTTGLGAVAAGTPRMVRPPYAPDLRPGMGQAHQEARPIPKAPPMSQDLPSSPTLGYGYLVKRALAYLTDIFWTTLLMGAVVGSWLWKQEGATDLSFSIPAVLGMTLLFLALLWTFVTLQETFWKTTLGKRLFGLRLQGSPGLIFLRAVFFVPSSLLMGGGILWGLFDRQRRCWHDRVVGIQPIEVVRF